MATKTRRPRYRKHRRHSRNLRTFLAAMAEKWSGEETEIAVDTVGSDVLALGDTPDVAGPFTLRGAPPAGFPRDADNIAKRFWIAVDESDNATIYTSRAALAAQRGGLAIDSWDLSPDMTSLTATAAVLNTLDVAATVDTLTELDTVDSLGTPVPITASAFAANTLTIVGHGYSVNDGPFYLEGADLPDGLAETTPYWIKTVPTADTFTLSASLGGAVIDTADDGSGDMDLVPVNVDVSLDTLEIPAHGLATGDGPLRIATDTTLPTGLAADTDYWAIVVTADRFKLATTRANAIDGTPVNLTGIGAGTQTVSHVNVDTTTETLFAPDHGLETGQLVRVTTDGALPTGIAVTTNYWIIAVDDDYVSFAASAANAASGTAISLTAVGSGTTTIHLANIDTVENTYTFETAHGFVTGDGPVRATSGTTLPTGVAGNTDFYVIRVSDTVLKLAATEAHALAGTPVIDITAIGAGTQTLTLAGVDVTEEHLRVAAHGMVTGDGPVRVSTDGALPTGLLAATDYWVIRLSADTFALAESRALALAGTKINLTGIGSGTHQLVRALTIGKDLSADGILEWLAQGVSKVAMQSHDVADVDIVFVN